MAKEKNTKRSCESDYVVIWTEAWLTRLEEGSVINETA